MSKAKTVLEVRILSGARAGEQQLFFDAHELRLGRHPTADVLLPDPIVSRQHARIEGDAQNGFRIVDCGSTAGLYDVATGQKIAKIAIPATGSVEVAFGSPTSAPRCAVGLGMAVPFGRYLLTGRLGGGGMAEVFLARQTGLGGLFRPVALKLIQPEMFALVDASSMFLDEARIASEINHHNVVKIFDVGEEAGVLFLAMEYLRGITVSNLIGQFLKRGETMPPDLAAAIVAQASAGLHAAHQLRDGNGRLLNVVHRDVSPSNLMVLPEGLVKVIDFGVARADTRLLRKEEGLQGKPAYMSPEQIQAFPLDARSDVFALGVVLYEMCSGQPLFARDDNAATFFAIVRGDIAPLRKVCPSASPRLEAVVAKALSRPLQDRFSSAAELAFELDKVVEESGGRFSSIGAVGRFLHERGIPLQTSLPSLLHEVPKALFGRKPQERSNEFFEDSLAQETFEAFLGDDKKNVPEAHESNDASGSEPIPIKDVPSMRSGDALLRRAGEPSIRENEALPVERSSDKVSRLPSDPKRSPAGRSPSMHMRPLAEEPHRLAGLALDGRYRLVRFIGSGPKRGQPFPKLYFLAELLSDGPGEKKARETGWLRGQQVSVAVCGKGPQLAPLSVHQHTKLQQLCASREPTEGFRHLIPFLSCGFLPNRSEADPDGSESSYLVMPLCERRLVTIGQLSTADRLSLIERLFFTLAQVSRAKPGFVHAAIRPANVGLCAQGDAVVLLDFCLELLLDEPLLPSSTERSLLVSPYLAPECFSGAPPSVRSDVFSVGVLAYEILGGDVHLLTQFLRSRRGIPRLPPQQGVPPHFENAILASLRGDPAQRPLPQELLTILPSHSQQPVQAQTSAQDLAIVIPPSGEVLKKRLRNGDELDLRTLPLPICQLPTALSLPLAEDQNVLPVPLQLLLSRDTIQIEIDEMWRGRDKSSLYHDARQPNTRCECLTLLPNQPAGHFEVGHRRNTIARIHYASTQAQKANVPLELALPEWGISVRSAGPLHRLAIVLTKSLTQPLWYAVCLCMG